MVTTDLIILALLIGLIPAAIASHKGHGFFVWWIFGGFVFILALPLALLAKDLRPHCPECTEPVKSAATRCPHCQAEIADRVVTA